MLLNPGNEIFLEFTKECINCTTEDEEDNLSEKEILGSEDEDEDHFEENETFDNAKTKRQESSFSSFIEFNYKIMFPQSG